MGIQEEDVLGKAYDHGLMARLLRYLKPYRHRVALGVSLSLLVSAMEAVRPWFVKLGVDEYMARKNHGGLLALACVFLGVQLLRAALMFVVAYANQWVGQKAVFDLRGEVFHSLQGKGLSYFDKNPAGRLVTRVTNDVDVLGDLFSSGIVMAFSDIFTISGILWFMFYMDWRLSLVTLSVTPFLFAATFAFRKYARESYRAVRAQLARINAFMQEHVAGMTVDHLFCRERRAMADFESRNAGHRDANIRSVLYYAVFYPTVEFIGALSVGLVLLASGWRAPAVAVSVGTVVAFLQFNEMFWRPIRDLAEKYNILQTAMASSERVFRVLDDRTEVPDPEAPPPLPELSGAVSFRDVWFAYDGDDWVLRGVSFHVAPGESVAVVGHTGAGKSTLFNILGRFYEFQRGGVFLDGVSIRNYPKAEIRRRLAFVFQDPVIFNRTVGDNIKLGRGWLSDADAMETVTRTGLDRTIDESRTGGRVAEILQLGANTLSQGQKQLVAFARALAGRPEILLLDEATANVDSKTEGLIQETVLDLMKSRTSITIAHRLSTVRNADRILVMHKGEVRESGTHAELMAAGGVYSRLYRLQYGVSDTAAPQAG